MSLKPIIKSIEIQASPDVVWNVLFTDANYRQWTAVFQEGSWADTDWQKGSKVKFMDAKGAGIFGYISESRPYEYLEITYSGFLGENGVEDTESAEAQSFIGTKETYTLTESDGKILLAITSDMEESYYDSMALAWDKALLKIKEMSE